MKIIDRNIPIRNAFDRIKKTARNGTFTGQEHDPYFWSCRWFLTHYDCSIIFTRDEGHHTCGWWKNPDYERCYHLSICFPGGVKQGRLKKVIDALFGTAKKYIWQESPVSEEGKKAGIWHYRVFCNPAWEPIMPRKEVYTTEFTELNWKSFSELNWK